MRDQGDQALNSPNPPSAYLWSHLEAKGLDTQRPPKWLPVKGGPVVPQGC